jgi:hypothetical protein
VLTIQSGNPFSILSGYETVDTLTAALNTADLAGGSTPAFGVNKSGYPSYIAAAEVSDFKGPTAGRLGLLKQRAFSGPWVSDLDLGLQKNFRVKEGQSLEFRGEALNVFNHASWLIGDQNIYALSPASVAKYGPVRSDATNPDFGRINSAFFPSRKVQVSVYFRF